ncbi:MAG: hypothetical protein J5911_02415 [Clostridia bacterium]|nr:hypothetical protein [Clostridia bacterium]
MSSRINKIVGKLKTDAKTRIFVLIVISLALVLIIGFNLFGERSEKVNIDEVSQYVSSLEQKLENLLNKIDGAGKVSVAITVESGMETVLATETIVKETSNGRETTSTPVMVNGKTVVLKETYPEISGVLIVSEGAGNISVYRRLQQATASLLNVKTSRIEILAMK